MGCATWPGLGSLPLSSTRFPLSSSPPSKQGAVHTSSALHYVQMVAPLTALGLYSLPNFVSQGKLKTLKKRFKSQPLQHRREARQQQPLLAKEGYLCPEG